MRRAPCSGGVTCWVMVRRLCNSSDSATANGGRRTNKKRRQLQSTDAAAAIEGPQAAGSSADADAATNTNNSSNPEGSPQRRTSITRPAERAGAGRGNRHRRARPHWNATTAASGRCASADTSRTVSVEEEPDDGAAYRQLIHKDLQRLPSAVANNSSSSSAVADQNSVIAVDDGDDDNSLVEEDGSPNNNSDPRVQILQRVLYIFATQHGNAGYLQGMHEIASYVLYALEMEKQQQQQSITSSGESYYLEEAENLEADCYILTERILTSLFPAYDVVPTVEEQESALPLPPREKPLEGMSRRILQATAQLNWPQLHQELRRAFAHIPSQLIFTKWIRLLYSREWTVVSHQAQYARGNNSSSAATMTQHGSEQAETVLKLWDALFEAASQVVLPATTASSSSSPAAVPPLQLAAEALAVARLWQHGNTILHLCQCQSNNSGQHPQQQPNHLLHWFMNMPPEPATEMATLIDRMRVVLLGGDLAAVQDLPPPLPVSPDVLALTAAAAQQQSSYPPSSSSPRQQGPPSSASASAFAWDSPGPLLAHAPKLASFTEKLAAKTQSLQKIISEESQSIQKRFNEEWESLQKQHEHNLRQEAARQRLQQEQQQQQFSAAYNLNYYGDNDDRRARQYLGSNDNNNSPTAAAAATNSPPNAIVPHPLQAQRPPPHPASSSSSRMQKDLSVLQEFLLTIEQQPGLSVPPSVWEALADLQRLQQNLH